MILLASFEVAAIVNELDGAASGYNRVVVFGAMDLALVVLVVAVAFDFGWTRMTFGTAGLLVPVMALLAAVAWLFHPSWRGASVIVRLIAAAVIVMEIGTLTRRELRDRVVVPLLVTLAIQAAIGVSQAIAQGPIGIEALGERTVFHQFGSSIGVQGTLIHPYPLAGFAMVAILATVVYLTSEPLEHRWRWIGAIAVAAIPLGITYSRMSVLALAATGAFLVWGAARNRAAYLPILAAVAVGAIVPGLIWNGGWIDRASDTVGTDIDAITSNRLTLTEQAIDLAVDNPFVGVGPGLYTQSLEQMQPDLDHYDAVHTVPLVVAVENGIPAGIVVTLLLTFIGVRALRSGPAGSAAFAGFIPFVMFDKFPYIHPNGLVMLAVWLAMLDIADHSRRPSPIAFDADHAKMTP